MKKVIIVIVIFFCALGNAQELPRLSIRNAPEGIKSDSIAMWGADRRIKHVPLSTLSGWINDAITGSATDDQQLSLSGNVISLENGGSVDLTPIIPDNQTLQSFDFNIANNVLSLTISNGNTVNVDLSSLAGGSGGTDNQQLGLTGNTLTLEDGGSVDLSAFLDNTDNQTLSIAGSNLSISGGNTITIPTGGSGGILNPNEFIVSSISDLSDVANAGRIACIQSNLIQTEDITLANDLILKDCGGVLFVNGFRLTGQDNGLIPDRKKVLIDAFSGTIDGTWNTPSVMYSTNFGLVGDAKELKDGAMTSGSAVLTSATANFTAADVGKVIGVAETQDEFIAVQPSNSRGTTIGTIVSVESPTSCTLSVAATRTASGVLFRYGSDNFTAGMNALYVRNQKPGDFIFSQGKYIKTEVDYNSLNPPVTRFGSIPNNWYIGGGTDDIHVWGEGATIMSLPNNLDGVHFFTLKDTHRSSVTNLTFDGEFQYHNHVGNFADEAQHGLVIQTASYNCTVKNVDITNFTGDGVYMSGDLQFTNAIKGSAATGYPGVSEFETGSIDETTGQFIADATKARTNILIDVTGFQFDNTRVINPNRDGDRHYQFSGSSFAGWSGLKNPIYRAYYYGPGGQSDFLGASEEREFYKTYTFPDGVESMLLVIDLPDDLTVIDAQLRAPVDPRGIVLDNVNVSDCGRHGGANLSSYTTWTNSVIENIGNTLPAFGINIEDQRRAATNYLFQNLTFRDCYSGGLNLVGTVNVDVIACKFEGTTDPGRLLHPDYMGAIGGWRGRNFKAIGNYINRGTFSVGRSGVYADNTVTYGSLAFEANGGVFRDGQLHQTVVTNVGGQSVNHRTLSYLKDTRMTYDRSMGGVFTNTNMYYNIENVEVIANEVSRLNNEVTPDTYEEIVLDGNNYLFSQTPAPTLDFGGIINGISFKGARPIRTARDYVSNNDWPVTDYYGSNYSESSITLSYGFPKDRVINNLTIDGWLDLSLTQFEDSVISETPTLTFNNLSCTIRAAEFDWTNTGAYVFETRAKNVNVVINNGVFDLQQTSGVIGSSNRFFRFGQLGFLDCNDCTFKSASPKTIDFNNTLQFPASTGPITLVNPKTTNITFIPRPQDKIIYTDLPDVDITGITDGQGVYWNSTNSQFEPGDNGSGGGATNLSYNAGTIESDTGTNATIPFATNASNGLATSIQITKLDGIEDAATADQTGAEIVSAIDTELGSNTWQSGGGSSTVDVVSNVANNSILGRTTTGAGDSEELTAAQVRTLINVEDNAAADQDATEVPFTSAQGLVATDVSGALDELKGITDSSSGFDPTTDKILDTGGNLSPLLGVANTATSNSNDYQMDMYMLAASGYIRVRNVTGGTKSSLVFDVTSLNPAVTGTTDFGFTSRRYRNLYLTGTAFVSGVSNGGDGSGFWKDNGTIDNTDYLESPSLSQYGINRTASINEAHGTVNFNNGTTLTYTIPVSTTLNFDVGTRILVNNENATSVTLTPDAGVTFVGGSDLVLDDDQAAILVKLSADEWLIINLN